MIVAGDHAAGDDPEYPNHGDVSDVPEYDRVPLLAAGLSLPL
jgi:hypothetical protein